MDGSGTCTDTQDGVFILRDHVAQCPSGFSPNYAENTCTNPGTGYTYEEKTETCGPQVGDPCEVATGWVVDTVTDYDSEMIPLERYYRSNYIYANGLFGKSWQHNYLDTLRRDVNGNPESILFSDGTIEELRLAGTNIWYAESSAKFQVRPDGTDWILYHRDGSKIRFNNQGRLEGKIDSRGFETTIAYNSSGHVDTVTSPHGHTLTFIYVYVASNGGWRITSITDPAGGVIAYDYDDANGNDIDILTSVTYPDQSAVGYKHVFDSHEGEYTQLLEAKTDELGVDHVTYTYDLGSMKVLTNEHIGGFDRVELEYLPLSTIVTHANGVEEAFGFSEFTYVTKFRKPNSRGINGIATTTDYIKATWDPYMRPQYVNHADGARTYSAYSGYHKTQQREAFGTSVQRYTLYTYLNDKSDRKTKVQTPSTRPWYWKSVDTTYNSNEQPLTITTSGYSGTTPVSQTVTMSYDSHGNVITIDGPRTDVSDVTTFTYYTCSTGAECGQLQSMTNALGHTTNYTSYDDHGRLLSITDANGLVTSYTYDARGRILSITQTPTTGAARVTTYTYDLAGQILTITTPDSLVQTHAYDAAHNLTSITDSFGNKIEFVYDLVGNVIEEKMLDSSSQLRSQTTMAYDDWKRVTSINSGGFVSQMTYDLVGNLTSTTDGAGHSKTTAYDLLQRPTVTTDALSAQTTYTYDGQNNVTSATVGNGAVTTFVYDDLGRMVSESSADRGLTAFSHDDAGNITALVDARGKSGAFSYDALNRVVAETYLDGESLVFSYDAGAFGKGLLTSVSDSSGSTSWVHSQFGDVTQINRLVGSVALSTSYSFDAAGRLISMTYPSGKVAAFTWDKNEQRSITFDGSVLLSGAAYAPSGQPTGWTWGVGGTSLRTYLLSGRTQSFTMPGSTTSLSYDLAGNLSGFVGSRLDVNYSYDNSNRLTSATANAGNVAPIATSITYVYDLNGNRTSETVDGLTNNYSIGTSSNVLNSVTGASNKTFTHDAAGNRLADGSQTFVYSDRSRAISELSSGVTYEYNALGQRVSKVGGSTTLFAYGIDGELLGEYDATGNPVAEHIYLEAEPVGVFTSGALHYVHSDHLQTPREITNSVGTSVWRWESNPFGELSAQEDPDMDQVNFSYNLRFPGQYYDSETQAHYNYFRTYDPSNGRYQESDPIGLTGGLNTFVYVSQDPLAKFDIYGLQQFGLHGQFNTMQSRVLRRASEVAAEQACDAANCLTKCAIDTVFGSNTSERVTNLGLGFASWKTNKYLQAFGVSTAKSVGKTLTRAQLAILAGQYLHCTTTCE